MISCVCIYVCMCMCVCVCVFGKMKRECDFDFCAWVVVSHVFFIVNHKPLEKLKQKRRKKKRSARPHQCEQLTFRNNRFSPCEDEAYLEESRTCHCRC